MVTLLWIAAGLAVVAALLALWSWYIDRRIVEALPGTPLLPVARHDDHVARATVAGQPKVAPTAAAKDCTY